MAKGVLIATGGTGGHIYPAIVTAEELRRRGWEVSFIGTFGAAAEKITSRGFSSINISVKGVVSKGPWQAFLALLLMAGAFFTCAQAVLRFRPRVVLGFGGYSSFPAVLAGRCLGARVMIHEQNVCPGLANKVLSRLAHRVAVSFKDAAAAFGGGKTVWTGCPIRPWPQARSREEILQEFGLDPLRKTVLVFGGSQGSRAINQAVLQAMGRLQAKCSCQLVHVSGRGQAEALREAYAKAGVTCFVREYLENIQDAYAIADMVIGRSGAGTVTELGLLGIPSILVPYPFAQSHQLANAQVLARHDAAVIIQEKDLNPDMLGDRIFSVLTKGLSRKDIAARLTADFAPDAVLRLADEVEKL